MSYVPESPVSAEVAASISSGKPFRLGEWTVHPKLNQLSLSGRRQTIEPILMEVLVALALRAGQVVSREELHELVWKDTVVTDKALTRVVSKLRRELRDDAAQPRYIDTVSKRGYRLIAEIDVVEPEKGAINGQRRYWTAVLVVILAFGVSRFFRSQDTPTLVPVPVTTFVGDERMPAVSPNGEFVAYTRRGPSGRWDLFVTQPGNGIELPLTTSEWDDLSPRWSPDGAQIAFARYRDDSCRISVVPALSGPVREVAECNWVPRGERLYIPVVASWSPDGSHMVVSRWEGDGPAAVYEIDIESGERRRITDPPDDVFGDVQPTYVPNSRDISFVRMVRPGIEDVYRVDPVSGRTTRLTSDRGPVSGHTWTGDGALLYSSGRGGMFRLWTVERGRQPRLFAGTGLHLEAPSAATEDWAVAFESWIYDSNLWSYSLADTSQSAGELLAVSTHSESNPAFSPDGRSIAFVSNRTGAFELWMAGDDGSSPRQLTSIGGDAVRRPRWSNDGNEIIYDRQSGEHWSLRILDLETGVTRPFLDTGFDAALGDYSPDGQWVYFSSTESGDWQIWRAGRDGTGRERVTREGGIRPMISPDGVLYYARTDTSGLWTVGPEGDEVLAVPGLARLDWGNWDVVSGGVVFLARGDEGDEVVQVDRASGAQRTVVRLVGWSAFYEPNLSISPDGRRVVVTRIDRSEVDIMMLAEQ